MDNFQIVTDYLIINRPRIILELKSLQDEHDKILKEVDDVFLDEANRQYKIAIIRHICDDVTKNLALDYESCYSVLEEVGVVNYVHG